jgi:hypothetical protein
MARTLSRNSDKGRGHNHHEKGKNRRPMARSLSRSSDKGRGQVQWKGKNSEANRGGRSKGNSKGLKGFSLSPPLPPPSQYPPPPSSNTQITASHVQVASPSQSSGDLLKL